jgi:large subunit ribosomal protein L23
MILQEVVKTEKAIAKIEAQNFLTFIVDPSSKKSDIADEVEKVFKVKVEKVRTFVSPKGKKHALVKLTKEFKADDIAAKMKMVA